MALQQEIERLDSRQSENDEAEAEAEARVGWGAHDFPVSVWTKPLNPPNRCFPPVPPPAPPPPPPLPPPFRACP